MKLNIKTTTIKEIRIDTPAFFKKHNSFYAVIDEQNILKSYKQDDYCSVSNVTRDLMSDSDWDFAQDENIISEKEFMDAFNQAHNFLSLKAELKVEEVTTSNCYDWEAHNNLKSQINY